MLEDALRDLAPELTGATHKGQAGKIAVLGGSRQYTGAPYFAAMTALTLGADLATVFCTEVAGSSIKAYSPELMVLPALKEASTQPKIEEVVSEITEWLPRLGALVIGPGMGKDAAVQAATSQVMTYARSKDLPLVIDADALFLLQHDLSLLRDYPLAILTPNAMEFRRLWVAAFPERPVPAFDPVIDAEAKALLLRHEYRHDDIGGVGGGGDAAFLADLSSALVADTVALARSLGVVICRKGRVDIISDGKQAIVVCTPGSPRRCGGQGDVLSGAIGVCTAWALARPAADSALPPLMRAALVGSFLTRCGSFQAFKSHGRGMLASHLIQVLAHTYIVSTTVITRLLCLIQNSLDKMCRRCRQCATHISPRHHNRRPLTVLCKYNVSNCCTWRL
jgi:ATP-dependent NAD(P)H-hydrate dehydratase